MLAFARRSIAVVLGIVALGCAGGVGDPPTPAAPSAPSPPEVPALEAWQRAIADKPTKNVRDYLMLLPSERLACEGVPPGRFDEAGRAAMITKEHVANGFLEVSVEGMPMQIALYKDRERGRDVVGTVLNCGMGCMCNHTGFQTWTDAGWAEVDVLDRDAIDARVLELSGPDVAWWPELPVKGTDTYIVDEDGERLLRLTWSEGRFAPSP